MSENTPQEAQKRAFVTVGDATHETPDRTTHSPRRDTTHETRLHATDQAPIHTPTVTRQSTTRRYKPRARKCACGCGATFTPKTRHGRYATPNCRKRDHARKQAKARAKAAQAASDDRLEVAYCLYCGASFFAPEGNGQLYCKPAHRTAAWRARRDATIRVIAEQHSTTVEAAERLVEQLGLSVVIEALRSDGYTYKMQARKWVKRGKVLQFDRAG